MKEAPGQLLATGVVQHAVSCRCLWRRVTAARSRKHARAIEKSWVRLLQLPIAALLAAVLMHVLTAIVVPHTAYVWVHNWCLQVYEATREAADWAELLQPQQTLGVHCLHFFNNSNVTHSQLVQRRVRDAVCDAVRDAR